MKLLQLIYSKSLRLLMPIKSL